MNRLLTALPLTLLLSSFSKADDWPQFRGPNRDAVCSDQGLLEAFPPDGVKIRWRVPVGGGYSSPVIAQGRVYLAYSEWKGEQAWEHLRCIDEKTGATLWTYSYPVGYDPQWREGNSHDGPRATPTIHQGKLYEIGADGDVFCLDAAKGELLWKKPLRDEYGLGDHRCITPSPLIEGDLLILVLGGKPDAGVVAFDRNTGKEVWRALEGRWTYSSPIIVNAGGQRQLIVWTARAVTSLDPATGKTYWREAHDLENGPSLVATPVVRGDLLLVSGMMFRLDAEKPAATLLWPESAAPARRVLSSTSMPLLQGDYIYSERTNGLLICLEAKTGKHVWKSEKVTRIGGGAALHLTPHGDAVWIFTDQGDLIRARLNPEGYQELSRAHVLDPTMPFSGRKVAWSPPAFANRHLFVRSERELVCASLAAAGD
ncbi:MAG TPA: PQQ-binding-like beta-propeller repeat protein [Planctomycetota bacterium]|nr:PQQ-binding-like beta-propeller repeat protein [Planctomycetota bacterium]